MNVPATIATVALPLLGGHGYHIGVSVYPSVTTVLGACGLGPDFSRIDPAVLAAAAVRGKFVHERCASYWLDSSSHLDAAPEEWIGYLIAFDLAVRALGLMPDRVESIASSERLRLAGRVDFQGRDTDGQIVIDYKTGPPDDAHALQTCAYALMVNMEATRTGGYYHRRACLYLAADSRWSLVPHATWTDEPIIAAAAIVANARLDRARRT